MPHCEHTYLVLSEDSISFDFYVLLFSLSWEFSFFSALKPFGVKHTLSIRKKYSFFITVKETVVFEASSAEIMCFRKVSRQVKKKRKKKGETHTRAHTGRTSHRNSGSSHTGKNCHKDGLDDHMAGSCTPDWMNYLDQEKRVLRRTQKVLYVSVQ